MSDTISFPTVVNKCDIFSLKCTRIRLAAGLRPDPLGELKHSPRPLIAAIRGKVPREGKGVVREGVERRREGTRREEERGGERRGERWEEGGRGRTEG